MNYIRMLTTLSREERIKRGIEYTPLEIEAQPRVWMKNFKMLKNREDEIREFTEAKIFSAKIPKVILSGAGSSAFIGLAVQNLLRLKWQVDVSVHPSTDIVTHWDSIFLKPLDNVLVSFSRSGNSPEAISTVNLADRFCEKINHIIITCNKEGQLAKMGREKDNALLLILSEDANDKGLAMTCSFTTMLMTAQFLAYINSLEEYEKTLHDLASATKKLFKDYSGVIKEISEIDFERAFFLGSGCLYGCAVESSLKLQEMTAGKVICKADTFMGVRHGPMVAINDETIVVYFLSTNPFVRRYELDLIKEVKNKGLGKKRVVVCNKIDKEIEECVDYAIEFNKDGAFEIPDHCRPIMDVCVGQMLGLFKSLNLDLKPDNPSERGIITRVVKGVKIYGYGTGQNSGF